MKTIELKNFIPFPGNYFSYVFDTPQNVKKDENILLKFGENKDIVIEANVIQEVLLDQTHKVQFHAKQVVPAKSISGDGSISESEITEFKDLLKKWDPEEYAPVPNHYFELMEKTKTKARFIELVGGAICRPNKFPFASPTTSKNAIKNRARILTLENCEDQLTSIRNLISSETPI